MTTPKVCRVSPHGFWLLLGDEELQLTFADFPWFKEATFGQLCDVEWLSPDHLYWPRLDVDLSIGSIHHPEHFSSVSKATSDANIERKTSIRILSSD
jgi:hypothetical protein